MFFLKRFSLVGWSQILEFVHETEISICNLALNMSIFLHT